MLQDLLYGLGELALGEAMGDAECVAMLNHAEKGELPYTMQHLLVGHSIAKLFEIVELMVDDGHVLVKHQLELEFVGKHIGGTTTMTLENAGRELNTWHIAQVVQQAHDGHAQFVACKPQGLLLGKGGTQLGASWATGGKGIAKGLQLMPSIATHKLMVAAGDGIKLAGAQMLHHPVDIAIGALYHDGKDLLIALAQILYTLGVGHGVLEFEIVVVHNDDKRKGERNIVADLWQ